MLDVGNHIVALFFVFVIESFLSLPGIPLQGSRYTIYPFFAASTFWHDIGKWEPRSRDCNIVPLHKFNPATVLANEVKGKYTIPFLAIKACPGGASGIVRVANSQHNRVRQDNRPKRKSMCTNCRHQNNRIIRMTQRTTGR